MLLLPYLLRTCLAAFLHALVIALLPGFLVYLLSTVLGHIHDLVSSGLGLLLDYLRLNLRLP